MAITRICSIPDCGKPHSGRGFCGKHIQRLRKYGDPLFFKGTENGSVGEFYNTVVLAYDGDECLTWPFTKNLHGRAQMGKDGRMRDVHRLVCEEEHGPPPTPKHNAAHSCGKGHLACVAKNHLSWKTPKENQADRLTHGTSNRGENNPRAQLSEAQAREIIALRGQERQKAIAEKFGVSLNCISKIHAGISWSYIER